MASIELRAAAQAVLDRWDSPAWEWIKQGPTGALMSDLRAALAEPTACAWHGDEDGAYETSCKHIFQMLDGTPQENDFTHCCFCGKPLEQHLWEYGNDE